MSIQDLLNDTKKNKIIHSVMEYLAFCKFRYPVLLLSRINKDKNDINMIVSCVSIPGYRIATPKDIFDSLSLEYLDIGTNVLPIKTINRSIRRYLRRLKIDKKSDLLQQFISIHGQNPRHNTMKFVCQVLLYHRYISLCYSCLWVQFYSLLWNARHSHWIDR